MAKLGYRFTATELKGIDTGHRRYRVECMDCGEVIHPATTGPEVVAEQHDLVCSAKKGGESTPILKSPPTLGTRVWYEPSEGTRFAGLVLGPGSLPECSRVMLCASYWYWKRDGKTTTRAASAIASDHLIERDGPTLYVDHLGEATR